MQKYAAFIAGLPTGRKTVSMDTLKALLAKLGFLNIETFLTSGNIIFETAPVGLVQPLEAQIARYLRKSLDVEDIWVFIRTPDELRAIVDNVPYDDDDMNANGNLLFIVLLTDEPGEQSTKRLRIKRNDVDDLRLKGREIYWLRRPSSEAVAPPSLSEILEAPATVRSFHTIVRLVERLTVKPMSQSPETEINPSAQSHP